MDQLNKTNQTSPPPFHKSQPLKHIQSQIHPQSGIDSNTEIQSSYRYCSYQTAGLVTSRPTIRCLYVPSNIMTTINSIDRIVRDEIMHENETLS